MKTTPEQLIKIEVSTDARADAVSAGRDGRIFVSVREKAKKGQANERVRELVARHFGVASGSVRIINGHHRPRKVLSIRI